MSTYKFKCYFNLYVTILAFSFVLFQDLVDNPQYSLILLNDTASVSFFSNADMATRPDLATIWQRTENNRDNFPSTLQTVDKLIIENPFIVYFGSKIYFSITLENFPCLIQATSKILASVSIALHYNKS